MTQEYKTLRELDVKPGDVVRNNVARTEIIADTSGHECSMESGYTWLWDNPVWRIVSRASDTPKLLRDMTDAEIGALVRANNEGKVIEGLWIDEETWTVLSEAHFHNMNMAYRVRPEPKRETVMLHGSVTDELWGRAQTGYDTYRITFDLIDGKPDCDSIKMEEL